MTISRQKIALVHVAKAQLELTDADYRELLLRTANVNSSTELDEAAFERLMIEFERLGFRHVKHSAPPRREGMASPAQISRIRTLWKKYTDDYDEPGLEHWLEVHLHVSAVRFCDASRAGKAVGILEKMVAGKRAKLAGDGGSPQAIGVKQ